jgi:uncharacterized protein YndB with AHSA1/START domain
MDGGAAEDTTMATETIEVTAVIPATAERIYEAWLDSAMHTAMTGGDAEVDASIDGEHKAWGGYISGKTLELEPGRRIVQSWYAADFPEGSEPSHLVVTIEADGENARVHLIHSNLPTGTGEGYAIGWQEHYFTPMMAYFETGGAEALDEGEDDEDEDEDDDDDEAPRKTAARKAAAKKSAARKPAAKKPAAKKATAKKPAAKKAAAKKATAKKPAAKKAAKKKATAKKSAKKPAAKKATAKKATAKKSAKKPAAKKATAKKAARKKPAAKKTAAKKSAKKAAKKKR